jgi:hypothetical protein
VPTTIPAIGEAQVDPDGVISGWCYCPARPAERVSVEILINDNLATTIVASRFLEDLRSRGIGDGYYGFSVTLTRQLNRMGHTGIVRVREKESGYCFWHWVRGDFSLPDGFAERLAAARTRIAALAARLPAPRPSLLGPAFAALGRQLAGQKMAPRPHALSRMPALSLIAPDSAAGSAPPGVELVLFGAAASSSPAACRAQTYLHLPGQSIGAQRRMGMSAATGAHLTLCGARLPETAASSARFEGIVICGSLGAALRRLVPTFAAPALPPNAAAGVLLAVPRDTYAALGGLAPAFDDGGDLAIADFALRAASAGIRISLADGGTEAEPATHAAGRAFLERWQQVCA